MIDNHDMKSLCFMGNPKLQHAILLFTITSLVVVAHVNSQSNFVGTRCIAASGNYTSDNAYKTSLKSVLSELTKKTSMNGFVTNDVPAAVAGVFYCRGDLDVGVCSSCVEAAARQVLSDCPAYKAAVIWYQECTLRYYANTTAAFLEDDGEWVGDHSRDFVADPSQFLVRLSFAMTALINQTAYGSPTPSFAVAIVNITNLQTLLCLVQCSPFVTPKHCDQCLNVALDEVASCCSNGSTWVRLFNPSCQMRYDSLPYYNISSPQPNVARSPSPTTSIDKNAPPPSPPPPKGKNETYYVTRVAVPAVLALLLVVVLCVWLRRKHLMVKNSHNQERVGNIVQGAMYEEHKIEGQGAEKFRFLEMTKATGSFSDANKLGQGGFGAVYKGILENGEEVAIKRLSKESTQGSKEFSTEVLIVAKLQHRNLVRLLGYCEENTERLIVYEYVPNLSLDQLLFDPSKSKNSDWRARCNIIFGIARGLRYLHHESRLNIVHRDLKTSNILLDADMNPKIADFGLAKLISLDHTHGDTTKVAGTLGYMAPEYIFQGQFSTRADVYSFGVILLEVVSGQKICRPNQSESNEGLLHRAWRHWEEGNFEELLDPTLRDNSFEVTKLVQIALLCVQQDPSTRPSMQMVLSWLNNDSVNIPSPVRPAALAFDTSSAITIGNSSSKVVEFTENYSTTSKCD